MKREKAEKFMSTDWSVDLKKFARRFNVDKGIDGKLIETKYYPGFKIDESKMEHCGYIWASQP
jgi:hypothetical protein